MLCLKGTLWIKWHFIERSTFKKDQIACNYCNFQCVAQSNKLIVSLKKIQLFIYIQSTQNQRLSTSYQSSIVFYRVTATEKIVFNAQSALAIF